MAIHNRSGEGAFGGMVPRASAESGTSQLNPLFPCRSCPKRLGEEGKEQNSSQKCGVVDRFLQSSLGVEGSCQVSRGEAEEIVLGLLSAEFNP